MVFWKGYFLVLCDKGWTEQWKKSLWFCEKNISQAMKKVEILRMFQKCTNSWSEWNGHKNATILFWKHGHNWKGFSRLVFKIMDPIKMAKKVQQFKKLNEASLGVHQFLKFGKGWTTFPRVQFGFLINK